MYSNLLKANDIDIAVNPTHVNFYNNIEFGEKNTIQDRTLLHLV